MKRVLCIGMLMSMAASATLRAQQPPVPDGEAPPYIQLNVHRHTAPIHALAFSPDGETLFSAGYDKVVHVWSRDQGRYVHRRTLRWDVHHGMGGVIYDLALGADGTLAIGGYGDRGRGGELVWFDANASDASYVDTNYVFRDRVGHEPAVWSVDFSPNSQKFVSADVEGRVLLWPERLRNPRSLQDAQPIPSHVVDPRMRPACFVGDSQIAYTVFKTDSYAGKHLAVWGIRLANADQLTQGGDIDISGQWGDFLLAVTAMAGSDDGRYLAAADARLGKLRLFDVSDPKNIRTQVFAVTGMVRSLAFSQTGDKTYLAVGLDTNDPSGNVGRIELWDTQQPSGPLWAQDTGKHRVDACALTADGHTLAFSSGNGNAISIVRFGDDIGDHGRVALQDIDSGEQFARIDWLSTDPQHPNDYRLLITNRQQARHLFVPADQQPVRQVIGTEIEELKPQLVPRFAAPSWRVKPAQDNGRLVAQVTDTAGKLVTTLPLNGESQLSCHAWIPGRRAGDSTPYALAIGTDRDNRIYLYRCRDWQLLRWYQGHHNTVNDLAVSPDGRYLASAADDGTARFWKLDASDSTGDDSSRVEQRWGVKLVQHQEGAIVQQVESQGPIYQRGFLAQGDVIRRVQPPGTDKSIERDIVSYLAEAPEFLHPLFEVERSGKSIAPFQTNSGWHPLLSLTIQQNDWVSWTPNGYFDSSLAGGDLVGYLFPREMGLPPSFEPAAMYLPRFYQPQPLRRLLETGDLSTAFAALQQPLLDPPNHPRLDMRPAIRMTGVQPKDDNHVAFTVEIQPPTEGQIEAVRVLGHPLGPRRDMLDHPTREPLKYEVEVPRWSKSSRLVVPGTLASGERELIVPPEWALDAIPELAKKEWKSTLVILAIGISDYSEAKRTDLKDAEYDAESVVHVLTSMRPADDVRVIYRDEAKQQLYTGRVTANDIAEATQKLLAAVKDSGGQADVVFFYAGHGEALDNPHQSDFGMDQSFCMIPSDGKRSVKLGADTLTLDFTKGGLLYDLADRQFRKVMLLDSCHSGYFPRVSHAGRSQGWPTDVFAATTELARPASLMASARGGNSSNAGAPHSDIRGGLFTQTVVRGLASEAFMFVESHDRVHTRALANYLESRNETLQVQPPSIALANLPEVVLTIRQDDKTSSASPTPGRLATGGP